MRRVFQHVLALLFVSVIVSAPSATSVAQSDEPKTCDDMTIVIDDAEALDEFSQSGCEVVVGDLVVRGDQLDIEALSGLAAVTAIKGDLRVEGVHSLRSLAGLEELDEVLGDVVITGNDGLESLVGFGATRVEGDLLLTYLPALESLEGLSKFRYVGGDLRLVGLAHVETLAGLGNVVNIGHTLQIAYLARLSTLEGADDIATVDSLVVEGNQSLESLDGLSNLSHIQRKGLTVRDNPRLVAFDAAPELEKLVGEVDVGGNGELDGCEVAAWIEKGGRMIDEETVSIDGATEDCK